MFPALLRGTKFFSPSTFTGRGGPKGREGWRSDDSARLFASSHPRSSY
jgi:hypothetical protein